MASEIKVDTISEKTSANGVSIDSVKLKDGTVDVNGVSDGLILDADADTTISADTDDQIDIKIAGADDFTFTANKLDVLSGSTLEINGTLDANGTEIILDADGDSSIRADADDLVRIKSGGNDSQNIYPTRIDFLVAALFPEATLTDASTISWNAQTQSVCKVTLAGNRTIGAPSNPINGQFISILVAQDGTGSRTLTWNAVYEFKDDTAPTLTTTASKGDLFVFRYSGSAKWLEVGRNQNLTLS